MSRFTKDPLGFIKRVIYKTIIGPIKYGRGNDYDAARYWDDRLSRYGESLKGAGDEGKSDQDNIREYERDEKIFSEYIQSLGLDMQNISVLDIGCGTGFYADILNRMGVKNYTGIDITDTLFEKHEKRLPHYEFIKKDFTTQKHDGSYDLIIMIEVLEHIVNDDKLTFCMENVKRCLKDDGVFVISSVWREGKRHLFYVRKWTLDEIKARFEGFEFSEPMQFRSANIIHIKRK